MSRKILAKEAVSEKEVISEMKSQQKSSDSASQTNQPSETAQDSAPSEVRLTADQLQTAINSAVSTAVDQATSTLRSQVETLTAQNSDLKSQNQSLEQVFKVLGHNSPNVNTHLTSGRDRLDGLAADFIQACESAPAAVWVNPRNGRSYVQRDMADAKRLIWSDRAQLRVDMETYAKNHGLLRGRGIASDAATTKADIPPALLDYLSLIMRETHQGRYIYWQFPFYKLELGKGPRDTIQVARLRWLPEAQAVNDRTLTPGVNLTSNRQNIGANAVSLTLGERGLGSGNPANSQPVAIPEFLIAYSMIALESAVTKVLGHDYESWEDLSIRSRYFATTRVVYNDRGNVTTNPAAIGANDDGTVTEMFLNNLYAYLSGLQIPPLDDGHYCYAVHDVGLAQLKNSLSAKNQYLSQKSVEELTLMLQAASNREMGKCSGYAGSACGFHLFATNAHSMGAAGTEGVQMETLGVGSTLTRSSLAFGQAAVARAIGMEAEVRQDNVNDFGRLESFTWLSHETTGDLDVDPAINAEQQLRVVEVHTPDLSV